MAIKKINKDDLHSHITVIARIAKIEIVNQSKNGYDSEMLRIVLRWSTSSIFVYEKELVNIKKMKNLKINDVVEIYGIFEHVWYPGAKSTIPVVAKILEFKKLGEIKNE